MQLAFDGAAVYALQISEPNAGNVARRGHVQLRGSRSLAASVVVVQGEDKEGTY